MENIEREVGQGSTGQQEQGNTAGQQQGNSGGGFGAMEDQAADGMVNQEIDKLAGDMGVPSGMDGAINQEVDQEVNKNI